MRTYMCYCPPTSGIAELGNVFLVKAKNEKDAVNVLHEKTPYHKQIKYEIVDIGYELKQRNYWSIFY